MTNGRPISQGYEPFPSFQGWGDGYDPSVVDEYALALDQARQQVTDEAVEHAVRVATRYAAVDTGAIEGLYTTTRGFTRTIAEQAANWEQALDQHDPGVRRTIDDALAAYEMVLDLTTGANPISQAWIRQIHEVICASQETHRVITPVGPQHQPLPTGRYKTLANNPTNEETGRTFHYAPPSDTSGEMERLVRELRTPAFLSAHSVVQAAYAHYAFVRIHPFADGNGRVARALASVFLYRRPGVPLVIFADQRDRYLDALEAADGGRPVTFVDFLGERTIDTIELVRLSLAAAQAPEAAAAAERLRSTLAGNSTPLEYELARAEGRVRERVAQEVRRGLDGAHLPAQVSYVETEEDATFPRAIPDGFTRSHPHRSFSLVVGQPVPFTVGLSIEAWRAAKPGQEPAFSIRGHRDSPALELRVRDVLPTLSTVADLKIDAWCERQVALLIRDADRRAAELAAEAADVPPTT